MEHSPRGEDSISSGPWIGQPLSSKRMSRRGIHKHTSGRWPHHWATGLAHTSSATILEARRWPVQQSSQTWPELGQSLQLLCLLPPLPTQDQPWKVTYLPEAATWDVLLPARSAQFSTPTALNQCHTWASFYYFFSIVKVSHSLHAFGCLLQVEVADDLVIGTSESSLTALIWKAFISTWAKPFLF